MPKRKMIVEVDIHDDKVSSIEDLEWDILHQCYGTFLLDFLCPKSILVPKFYKDKWQMTFRAYLKLADEVS
jgi:hypothetical protein